MSRYHSRGKSSTYMSGPKQTGEWIPRIDKEPFYRPHDIYCSIIKERLRLDLQSTCNKTDLKTIFVNLKEKFPVEVSRKIGWENNMYLYRLSCGHRQYEYRKQEIGGEIDCLT